MADITYIPIRQLHPHPDNPRKELGDLTELAASIKENGVYQNLTVIPGHYLGKQEYIDRCIADGGNGYWGWVWKPDCQSGGYGWEENGSLDAIYALLTALGYEMSDEEKALQNGTHAIFSANDSQKGDSE